MVDPFLVEPPAVLSISGGRTSGYMLWLILQAHGGQLPDGVVPVFTNTGKEREETLLFLKEIGERWGVTIRWLEYRFREGVHAFAEVSHETASRKGEPFEMVIEARQALPNVRMRFCTGELKIRTCNRFVRQTLGWTAYTNAIGLRYDEPGRVSRLEERWLLSQGQKRPVQRDLFGGRVKQKRIEPLPPGERPTTPLFAAKITKREVAEFWSQQPFDLGIPSERGNCDGCFLKGVGSLLETFQEDPSRADWWAAQEAKGLGRTEQAGLFRAPRTRPTYAA